MRMKDEFETIVKWIYEHEDWFDEYENLRDGIHALGADVMPYVLEAARTTDDASIQELFIMLLADVLYPPALPHFVRWLDHPNEQSRWTVAYTLNDMAGKRFSPTGFLQGGWMQHDEVAQVTPAIKEWWREEGQYQMPSLPKWRAAQAAKVQYSEREKWYNFVQGAPKWVMLGNKTVIKPETLLPRHLGIHLVGATTQLQGEEKSRFAVVELDSHSGDFLKIVVKENRRWRDVTTQTVWSKLNYTLAGH